MESPGADNIKKVQEANRTAYLVAGYIRRTLTTEEKEELDDWIVASENNMRLFGELTDEKNIAASLQAYDKIDVEQALLDVKGRMKLRSSKLFWQYAIAASILLIAGLTLFLTRQRSKNDKDIVHVIDLTPGNAKATLTMEDGRVIALGGKDTNINSTIHVSAAMNQINYESTGHFPDVYHTLTIPKKGYFGIVLDDGTRVWLNSASSIRFPKSFSDTQRIVYITGEAYFDVAKDPVKPFRVVAGGMLVQALGTQFNVNAYEDEPIKVTTLVEGKVKVFIPGDSVILVPGEQSSVAESKITKTYVEIITATAWKDNKFKFRNTPIDAVMRQLARWYDADIVFKEPVDAHLNATIDRSVPISKVLELLQATGEVNFKVDDKIITVSR